MSLCNLQLCNQCFEEKEQDVRRTQRLDKQKGEKKQEGEKYFQARGPAVH
jgi:hypothetical protein